MHPEKVKNKNAAVKTFSNKTFNAAFTLWSAEFTWLKQDVFMVWTLQASPVCAVKSNLTEQTRKNKLSWMCDDSLPKFFLMHKT